MTHRAGFSIPIPGLPLREHRTLLERAPDWGYTDVWTAESAGPDAFTPLALAAAWCPSLRLGTSVIPAQTRGPATLAMTAATLAEATDAEVVVGIGASGPPFVEDINGIPFREPYRHVRDTARFLRTAFHGELVQGDFDTFRIKGFHLSQLPPRAPRVMLGALRPGMLRLAAREADQLLAPALGAELLGDTRYVLDGQDVGDRALGRFFVCPTADRELGRMIGRRVLTPMLMARTYWAFHSWLGRADLLGPMREAWLAGDWHRAQTLLPDRLLDELFVHGSPEECREHLERFVAAGIDTTIIALIPPPEFGGGLPGATAALHALSPAGS
ncbi:LLM class F420-dependent oxidoreductase [Streptomyces sp. NPDC051578]|uniref:LLM class F420-dependent oxidoreductase n=1 Tax=Streptomyces sp. NPDC051578 TaxID=3365662 RepID=UPI00378B24A9